MDPLAHIDAALETVWVAGLLEGEGTFGIYGGYPQLALQMTDRDVVERVSHILGSSLTGPYVRDSEKHSPVWKTTLCRSEEVVEWCQILRPYMSFRRQGQIDRILAWAQNRSS